MKNAVFYSILMAFFLLLSLPMHGTKRQMEALDRGLIVIKVSSGTYISWRLLGNEKETSFNIYKNGTLFKTVSKTEATNISDPNGKLTDKYFVKSVINGEEKDKSKEVVPLSQNYLTLQLKRPAPGITPPNLSYNGTTSTTYSNGESYRYFPNDCSAADLDGDGEYEIIVKWQPTNWKDNAHWGITGPTYIDAYKLDGTFMWRIDFGKNIRSGSHYNQFLVYDFDGDGKAEIVGKTAPGTIDGKGKKVVIGSDDPDKDWRNLALTKSVCGYVLNGPEYLTIFNGETGAELSTVPYEVARGKVSDWGDDYGNRVDRFLACVAYLDGEHPSIVMCRGYYAKTTLAAYDFKNGQLVKRWVHISATAGQGAYGQGNHNLAVADVDNDGFDEIIYGACAIDNDGSLLYRTGLGHGDAMHIGDLDPDRPGLEVFQVHEEAAACKTYGYEMHDAKTGQILCGAPTTADNGRGLAADIDPNHRGYEMWSAGKTPAGQTTGTYNCKGEQISSNKPTADGGISFRIYWDGDLQDEILGGNVIYKWNGSKANTTLIFSGMSSFGSKMSPNLVADLFGDWREEIILFETADSSKIRIYTTTTPTTHRLYTLMHDPVYRLSIAWQNVAYNQPPHLGFYIGDGVGSIPWPDMYMPQAATGIDDVKKDNSNINAYIDSNGMLKIYANSNIKMVHVYSINGMLLQSIQHLNNNDFEIDLSRFQSPMLIVKVTLDSETKTFKLLKN